MAIDNLQTTGNLTDNSAVLFGRERTNRWGYPDPFGQTMATSQDVEIKAAATYNAASDFYDHAANSFWNRFGQRTIARLALKPGASVLDICCGTGASALPAAEAVGPTGSVLGVDLAEDLLDLARAKTKARGLSNIEFRVGDMLDLGLDAQFEAVVCVFGIFFVPDMSAAIRELWRMVRPAGQLAITTWGPNLFEPLNTVFWNVVRELRPDLHKAFNPWDRIADQVALRALFAEAGVEAPDIVAERGTHSIPSPEHGWALIQGSGYRGTVEQLDADGRERIRQATLAFIRSSDIESVEANVMYAVATKT